jgi:hypothetical protein
MSEVINGVTEKQVHSMEYFLSNVESGIVSCELNGISNLDDLVYKLAKYNSLSTDRIIKDQHIDWIRKFINSNASNDASEINTFIEAFNQFIDANFPGEKHADNLKDVSDFIADLAAKVSSSEAIACQSASLFANADQVARNLATLNEHNKQLQDQVAYLYEENEALKKQLANK